MASTDIEYVTPVIFVQYPAKVFRPDGTMIDKARAVVTPDRLVVYTEEPVGGGRRRAHTEVIVAIEQPQRDPESFNAYTMLEAGTDLRWTVQKGSGCGCRSPLKGMQAPYPLHI